MNTFFKLSEVAAIVAMLDRDALALIASQPHEALRHAVLAALLRQGVPQ